MNGNSFVTPWRERVEQVFHPQKRKYIEESALMTFIHRCDFDGMPAERIIEQLEMFLAGIRSVRLHDNASLLMDGEKEI